MHEEIVNLSGKLKKNLVTIQNPAIRLNFQVRQRPEQQFQQSGRLVARNVDSKLVGYGGHLPNRLRPNVKVLGARCALGTLGALGTMHHARKK